MNLNECLERLRAAERSLRLAVMATEDAVNVRAEKPGAGMKLYIWCFPHFEASSTLWLTVVAGSVDDARKMALSKAAKRYEYGAYRVDSPTPAVEIREPERILDLPCAEWYECPE